MFGVGGVAFKLVKLDAWNSAFAVVISVTKEGVKFSTRGDIGTANIVCRQNTTVDKVQALWYEKLLWAIENYRYLFTFLLSDCNVVFAAWRSHCHRDEWACVIDLCTKIHELFHQGNTTVKHRHHQFVFRAPCCGWIQDCWNGLHQVLLGSKDWRGWEWVLVLHPTVLFLAPSCKIWPSRLTFFD